MYREEIKVLDCTIRDGGICNNWAFSHEMVQRVFKVIVASGIDYMEVGYRTKDGIFDPSEVGPWRFCKESDLEKAVEPGQIKLSTMLSDGDEVATGARTLAGVARCASSSPVLLLLKASVAWWNARTSS